MKELYKVWHKLFGWHYIMIPSDYSHQNINTLHRAYLAPNKTMYIRDRAGFGDIIQMKDWHADWMPVTWNSRDTNPYTGKIDYSVHLRPSEK
jgi:hypothetical protein